MTSPSRTRSPSRAAPSDDEEEYKDVHVVGETPGPDRYTVPDFMTMGVSGTQQQQQQRNSTRESFVLQNAKKGPQRLGYSLKSSRNNKAR